MDSLDVLQKAWVVEGAVLLLYLMIACVWMPMDRLTVFQGMLPQVMILIGAQGAVGGAGPAVKRVLENKKTELLRNKSTGGRKNGKRTV